MSDRGEGKEKERVDNEAVRWSRDDAKAVFA